MADEVEPRGLRGYLAGENDGPGGESVNVPLRRRDGSIKAYALIDAVDADGVMRSRWYLSAKGYVVRSIWKDGHKPTLRLHRVLLGLEPGDPREVDHINRDKLDNRRANLRIVTRAENGQNVSGQQSSTSAYRGVHWDSARRCWRAKVKISGRERHVGRFASEQEAGLAVAAARTLIMPFSVEPVPCV